MRSGTSRGGWRRTQRWGHAQRRFFPFGLMNKTKQVDSGERTRNESGAGFFFLPIRIIKPIHVARWLLAMSDATGKTVYRERAAKWFKLMKSRIEITDDGAFAIGNYWRPPALGTIAPRSHKQWVGVHPNAGDYQIDLPMTSSRCLSSQGLVFNPQDIEKKKGRATPPPSPPKRDWSMVSDNPSCRSDLRPVMKAVKVVGALTAAPKYNLGCGVRRVHVTHKVS